MPERCPNCHNETYLHLIYQKTWFEYFFIKLFAYRKEYYLVCRICSRGIKLRKDEIETTKNLNRMTLAYRNRLLPEDEYLRFLADAQRQLNLP